MSNREKRLRVTALKLSEMLELLRTAHETLLPHEPKRYWIDSQSPLELSCQLAKELRELLGVEAQDRERRNESGDSPVPLPPLSAVNATTNPLPGKE